MTPVSCGNVGHHQAILVSGHRRGQLSHENQYFSTTFDVIYRFPFPGMHIEKAECGFLRPLDMLPRYAKLILTAKSTGVQSYSCGAALVVY